MTQLHAVSHIHGNTPEAQRATENPAKASDRGAVAPAPLSVALWNVSWDDVLPYRFGSDGAVVRWSTFENVRPFIEQNYARIFEEPAGDTPFTQETSMNRAKARYYAIFADVFEFLYRNETIGILICTPLDWSTYYIRTAALLPEHQGRQWVWRFVSEVLFDYLAPLGVERVEFDVSPANMAMLHLAARNRCNPTGTLLTERWGSQVRFTRFLNPQREAVFLDQFCNGIKYQTRTRRNPR
ncbi:MAG: hypothetical protein DIU78_006615 [Pseudomonadota bacterium]|nr:MAG: hypothetical protein DIU78_10260 [Pseudomonadota bacterium]